MITVKVEEEMERIRFADRAARYFALHPECQSFSDADISPGCLLALRWGLGDDCVLVLKLDPFYSNYVVIDNIQPMINPVDWFYNKPAAIKHAEEMRVNKIASLKRQIAKLESMKFE